MLVNERHFWEKNTEWSVHCYTVLGLFLWISGMLNDVFVSGLPALVGFPVYPQLSRSFHYLHAPVCHSHAFGRCFMFYKSLLVKCPVFLCSTLSLKIPSVSTESSIFKLAHVPNRSLIFIAKWHVTVPAYCHCIVNYYLQ